MPNHNPLRALTGGRHCARLALLVALQAGPAAAVRDARRSTSVGLGVVGAGADHRGLCYIMVAYR
jgi:hypothetical protein